MSAAGKPSSGGIRLPGPTVDMPSQAGGGSRGSMSRVYMKASHWSARPQDEQHDNRYCDDREETIEVQTDVYLATFSNRGAVLKSLKLRDYFIDAEVQKDPERIADPANWLDIVGEVKEGTPSFLLKEAGGGKSCQNRGPESTRRPPVSVCDPWAHGGYDPRRRNDG